MKKTVKTKNAVKAKTPSKSAIAHRIDSLVAGRSVVLPDLGVVKCTKAARDTKDHKRRFSVSKSTVVDNRRGYTFTELMEAFKLRG